VIQLVELRNFDYRLCAELARLQSDSNLLPDFTDGGSARELPALHESPRRSPLASIGLQATLEQQDVTFGEDLRQHQQYARHRPSFLGLPILILAHASFFIKCLWSPAVITVIIQ
jgi:hypothetical protein